MKSFATFRRFRPRHKRSFPLIQNFRRSYHNYSRNHRLHHLPVVFLCSTLSFTALTLTEGVSKAEDTPDESNKRKPGVKVEGLPEYRRSEVEKHCDLENGIWVTFQEGVYDITEFVTKHPGGSEKIMGAAGGDILYFWNLYRQHFTQQVLGMLEDLRIGNLHPDDVVTVSKIENPYAQDPKRDANLIVLKKEPFNAETPLGQIPDNYYTPNHLWYTRHHHPVPEVPENIMEYDFTVEKRFADEKDHQNINGGEENELLLQDIFDESRFPNRADVSITLQCAGNRRKEMNDAGLKEVKHPTQGLKWGQGAVSTARFQGIWLRDLLKDQFGFESAQDAIDKGVKWVHFYGGDEPYDAAIPIEKAMDPRGDVILATHMNGELIPRDHGAPLRVVCPGYLAARSVKWLKCIAISDEESVSPWQRGPAYKSLPQNLTDLSQVDSSTMFSVMELPVQSAICIPNVRNNVIKAEIRKAQRSKDASAVSWWTYNEEKKIDEKLLTYKSDPGTFTVKGFAWSGGGRNIVRVEVSMDDGKTWVPATLEKGKDQGYMRAWAWTHWQVKLPIPHIIQDDDVKEVDVVLRCKATDCSMNSQPSDCIPAWNVRGILNNTQQRLPIRIVNASQQ